MRREKRLIFLNTQLRCRRRNCEVAYFYPETNQNKKGCNVPICTSVSMQIQISSVHERCRLYDKLDCNYLFDCNYLPCFGINLYEIRVTIKIMCPSGVAIATWQRWPTLLHKRDSQRLGIYNVY